TLGIMIGVAAVIAMSEIGQGSSVAIQKRIESMGANNILIMPGAPTSGGVSFGSGGVMTLTPEDGKALLRDCSGIVNVAPVIRSRTQVI
ncbi:ABC transporter permease, partial [Acinetobacter baumannii]